MRDTGIGIAPEAQARIFDEFEQADGGAARKFGGTGLGLAISRRIVDRMGGKLTLDSDARRGSTFTLSLPSRRRRTCGEPPASPQLNDVSVLIVAPHRIEAALVARRLQRLGRTDVPCRPDVDDALLELSMRAWGTVIVDNAIGSRKPRPIAEACVSARTRLPRDGDAADPRRTRGAARTPASTAI